MGTAKNLLVAMMAAYASSVSAQGLSCDRFFPDLEKLAREESVKTIVIGTVVGYEGSADWPALKIRVSGQLKGAPQELVTARDVSPSWFCGSPDATLDRRVVAILVEAPNQAGGLVTAWHIYALGGAEPNPPSRPR
jgi:hypothetical protein